MNKNKIERAYNLVISRLPKDYPNPKIKICNSADEVIRLVYKWNKDYYKTVKQTKEWYTKRFQNTKSKTNYINTKYYLQESLSESTWKDISMVATEPILINKEVCIKKKYEQMVFIFLHEIGHFYNQRSKNYLNERMADQFAIRWIRKFIKEGLISDYTKLNK